MPFPEARPQRLPGGTLGLCGYGAAWAGTAALTLCLALGVHLWPWPEPRLWWARDVFGAFLFVVRQATRPPWGGLCLAGLAAFALGHQAWLARWERRHSGHAGARDRRLASLRIGALAGLGQVVIVCMAATLLHLFNADAWQPASLANRIHAVNRTLLIYGPAAWLASVAAGGVLGRLRARGAART